MQIAPSNSEIAIIATARAPEAVSISAGCYTARVSDSHSAVRPDLARLDLLAADIEYLVTTAP